MRLTDKEQWGILLEEMNYMALLRNLRNFDKAGISKNHADRIAQKLANPKEVANSKQLPFRFYTAWLNTPAGRWHEPLETALQHSLPNIPVMDGRSLILIDTSGSMQTPMSNGRPRGPARKVRNVATLEVEDAEPKVPDRVDAGALFGLALALRNAGNVDVWGFADSQMAVTNLSGSSLLKAVEIFSKQVGKVGHGTQIERAIRDTYDGQDRVFVFTDMQTMPAERSSFYGANEDVTRSVPADKHVYGFDLSGYAVSAMESSPYRHEMGGLGDHTFGAVPLIESGVSAVWPWS